MGMKNFEINKCEKTRGCNICNKKNYESELRPGNEIHDIYELRLGNSFTLALCETCIDELVSTIGDFAKQLLITIFEEMANIDDTNNTNY